MDTARLDAIQNHEVKRPELWITSKLGSNCHSKTHIEAAPKQSLENLGVDDLNLYLIHWPVGIRPEKTFAETVDDLLTPEQSPISETGKARESTRGCSPAQVVLAWDEQRGISAIPKSVKPSRLLEN